MITKILVGLGCIAVLVLAFLVILHFYGWIYIKVSNTLTAKDEPLENDSANRAHYGILVMCITLLALAVIGVGYIIGDILLY